MERMDPADQLRKAMLFGVEIPKADHSEVSFFKIYKKFHIFDFFETFFIYNYSNLQWVFSN